MAAQPAAAGLMEELSEDGPAIRSIADRLRNARSRGELGALVAHEVLTYSL